MVEIPLVAMYVCHDIPEADLPIKMVGWSRCYRAEAGARGVDTKGLYRVHEFTKVELFAWTSCDPEPEAAEPAESESASTDPTSSSSFSSTAIFKEFLSLETEILASLSLPCRILEMPSSDLGASA
jgi:seryl-tRNA synthetase